MPSAYVIELDGSNLYLRDHDDGAISWTGNPHKAARFGEDMEAEAFARKSGITGNISVQYLDFGPWG